MVLAAPGASVVKECWPKVSSATCFWRTVLGKYVSGSKTVKGLLYLFVLSVCSLLESLLGRSRLRVRSLSAMLELTSLKV